MTTNVKHPAKYSPQILDTIRGLLNDHFYTNGPFDLRSGAAVQVLDPFAGVGLIHELSHHVDDETPYYSTFAIELEPEWADESAQLGLTWQGDWLLWDPGTGQGQSPFTYHDTLGGNAHEWQAWLEQPHAIVTSTTYGNRMADHHDAKERCRQCTGTGYSILPHDGMPGGVLCDFCDGEGRRDYTRMTYKHVLGRDPTEGSSCTLQWGPEYRAFHHYAWRKVWRVLPDGGIFILNVKNHVRKGKVMKVAEWHRDVICARGFHVLKDVRVPVKGMRMGENNELRVNYEHVYMFKKAA